MGYKNVCLNCRRVENLGTDFTNFRTGDCPDCSTPMRFVSQKFRPPKKTDDKSWAVSSLLILNGFTYYTIRDVNGMAIPYPTTIDDAKRFINAHQSRAGELQTKRKHEIEKQIADLESRPPNQQRTSMICKLKQELSNAQQNL